MSRFALLAACLLTTAAPAVASVAVRVATFNVSLFGRQDGEILARLNKGDDPQARHIAEIIQRVRPEVLLLNEIDYDPDGAVLAAFAEKYLAVDQNASGAPDGPSKAIAYPYRYVAPANTGVHSGFDLDHNGKVDPTPGSRDYGSDCWGYGVYPGQYSLAILSQHPIDKPAIRTFRTFAWNDMPGALLPDDPTTPAPADWYSADVLKQFPLSSKNHCDVPITVRGKRIHLLVSHPTPPVYDGPEDRNGRRNHDEIRFWADYTHKAGDGIAGPAPTYIHDDAGQPGGLPPKSTFLILGDLNSDPVDGDGGASIAQLLNATQILKYPFPRSAGGAEAAKLQGGANARHHGDPHEDTEDPNDDPGPGNLHLDFILPSTDLRVTASGVFWPESTDPLAALVAGAERPASSDHRLVWVDLAW